MTWTGRRSWNKDGYEGTHSGPNGSLAGWSSPRKGLCDFQPESVRIREEMFDVTDATSPCPWERHETHHPAQRRPLVADARCLFTRQDAGLEAPAKTVTRFLPRGESLRRHEAGDDATWFAARRRASSLHASREWDRVVPEEHWERGAGADPPSPLVRLRGWRRGGVTDFACE